MLFGSALAALATHEDLETTIQAALHVDCNNRQLHDAEIKWIKENAEAYAAYLQTQGETVSVEGYAAKG
ncbi:MAG: hypothetical protein ACR2RB_10165 [Gammaproteobacteria bacterium]